MSCGSIPNCTWKTCAIPGNWGCSAESAGPSDCGPSFPSARKSSKIGNGINSSLPGEDPSSYLFCRRRQRKRIGRVLVQLPNNLFQVAQFGHHGHLLALRKEEKLDSNKTTRLLQCTCHDGLEASNKEAIATAFLHQGRLEGLFFRLLKEKKSEFNTRKKRESR